MKIEISDNDANGHFLVPKIYEFSLNESTIEGYSIGRIQVVGAIENALKFQFHNNATEIPFRLDANSGEVFVSREVDFETVCKNNKTKGKYSNFFRKNSIKLKLS